jgi:hypothetical protein
MRVTVGKRSPYNTVSLEVERAGQVEHHEQRFGKTLEFPFAVGNLSLTALDPARLGSVTLRIDAPKFWLVTKAELMPRALDLGPRSP